MPQDVRRPPAILRVSLTRADGRRWGLWVPLFLLWPVAAVLAAAAAPLWLLAGVLWWAVGRGRGVIAMPWRWAVAACSLPGLLVEIERHGERTMRVGFW